MKTIDIKKARNEFPQYGHMTDTELVAELVRQFPQYGDKPSNADTLREQTRLGPIAGWFENSKSKTQAEILANRASSADSITRIERNVEASQLGVSVETLDQMKMTTHQTDQVIRIKEKEVELKVQEEADNAKLALHVAQAKTIAPLITVEEIRRRLFDAMAEYRAIEKDTSDPDRIRKLRFLDSQIKELEGFNGREIQGALQESDRGEVGGPEADDTESREHNE